MSEKDPYYKEGYDAYINLWARDGEFPRLHQCPALTMPSGTQMRRSVAAGWADAKKELIASIKQHPNK